ncbi:SET domain-containing protein 4 [Austrofundulus limnaeus]|uniref:SET domain-containing protein 4 n=1 Tax=Austrofundulus limnaeus TaxID=52670 RepID=A0A2I4CDX1_AUSLI|nr:PREDICTED: SET domain-containing protein 4 [Austrofundulus limnaeus]
MGASGLRLGRAARSRRQKRRGAVRSVSLSHLDQSVRLRKFLHQRGFTSTLLQPAHFTDTGRGLQTLQNIKPGEMIISLPESCLLTTTTVLNSYLGSFIKSWRHPLSPLLVLCVFLVCERHRGEASDWFPYISALPTTYTCPAYFSDMVVEVLPAAVRRRAVEQREAVRDMHSSNQDFFRSLQLVLSRPVQEVLTYEALRWAWCSVNTRSVFMSRPSNDFLSGQDNYALAPFLDLLNHQPDLQVTAGFNDQTRCYEIRSVSGMKRYQQAFINYGCHDNQRLLLEYGFVATNNPHSVVYVETDLLCDVLRGDKSLDQKIKFLRENQFLHNLTVSSEGPSWRLMTALRLLSLSQTQFHLWKAALLGQLLCEHTEEWSVHTARTICQQLLSDTHTALHKISLLLHRCEQPIREQLDVVRLLRQEEGSILQSCLQTLEGSVQQAHTTPDVGAVR